MPDSPYPDSLDSLRERWRQDRSSRLFLQLAEELRRAGELEAAITVLGEGLMFHSHSVAGLVALGRCQLEAGNAEAATVSLERALDIDPAQLVANKLITEAWLRLGDAPRARRRLEIYRLLNERDQEIESYEERLGQLEGAGAVADEGDGAEVAAAPIFELAAAAPPVESIAVRAVETGTGPTPFAGLAGRGELELRARTAGADESVFRLWTPSAPEVAVVPPSALAPEAVEEELAEAPLPATAGLPQPGPVEIEPGEAEAAEPPSEESPEEAGGEAPAEPAPPAEDATPLVAAEKSGVESAEAPAEPLYSLTSIGQEVESEPLEPETAAGEAPAAGAGRRESAGAKTIPAASSTLAALYLQQGHLNDAEREFRAVLDLRPGDAAAVEGLERVIAARAAASGHELTTVASRAVAKPGRAGGLTGRRIEALSDLLGRLRERRKGGHRVP